MKQNMYRLAAAGLFLGLLLLGFDAVRAFGRTPPHQDATTSHQQPKSGGKTAMTEAAAQFSLSSIGQISINVHDVKRATGFYRDTLGMRFLFEAGHMAFFDCGGVRLMLSTPEEPEFDHPSSFIYYRVADIHRSYEILLARGVHFEEKPRFVVRLADHDLWMAFFRDPDNNPLVLMSEVPRAG